jgi:hypothetical protein
MARPYPAGDLSRAQSSQLWRRPAASGPGVPGPFNNQRAYLPRMFLAPSLLFPTAPHTGFRAGVRVRERGPDLKALSSAFAFLNGSIWRGQTESASRSRFALHRLGALLPLGDVH